MPGVRQHLFKYMYFLDVIRKLNVQ